MKCSVCHQEFGNGAICAHCGTDRITGLGDFQGYTIGSKTANGTSHLSNNQVPEESNTVCWNCENVIPITANYCPYCQTKQYVICPKCGERYSSRFPNCPSCGTNPAQYSEEIDETVKQFEEFLDNWGLVYVEGGSFQMGATPEQEASGPSDRKPVHTVSVDSFLIARTPVTQELWQKVMGYNSSKFKGVDLPVTNVSMSEIYSFINKISEISNLPFRLPTEAEWEYAARGGKFSQHYKYPGSNNIDEVAWFDGNSEKKVHPVCQKKPNELGIFDMGGNVFEMVKDIYSSTYYSNCPSHNPVNTKVRSVFMSILLSANSISIRGGSCLQSEKYSTCSHRMFVGASDSVMDSGFRLALDIPDLNNS